MATEDGSVKIKVNMDITDVGTGVKDIGAQLKRVNVAAGNAGETLRSALVTAVDAATGKSMQGQIFSLGSKLAALGPTFQKALAGNKTAVNDFQAKTADIAESISRLWNGLRQLGEAQYNTPELDALNGEIDEAERKALELKDTFHTMQDAGSTVKNDARFKQVAQEYLQALNDLKGLQDKRDALIKSGKGLVSFKDSADFQGMAASLDAVNGRLTGMQERLVEAAINAAAARREAEAAAAAEAAALEEAARRAEAAAAAEAAALEEAARQAEAAEAEAQEAVEAAEAQRLDDIAQSAQVGSQAVVSLTQELEQLQARQQELNAAGVGMGYEEYDANAERIRAVTAALREYAATGSDAQARTMAPEQSSWERFRQKMIGVAASLGLVRKQTNDTSGAMKRLRTSAGTAASGVGSVFKKVLRWGLGIGSVTMLVRRLWSAVKEGLSIMAQHDTETANTLNGLKTALTNVKLSLATAFGPVLTAVAPLLIKLSDLVTRAANAVARFFAILTGKSTYKRAVAAQDAITDSVAGTGAAAKEAAKNLSGLDELNIWQENRDGSGGGGGGASTGPDVDLEEVETGAATDFMVRLKDILFEWDDLDPELIAEKILTGLCAATGGIIGYSLGGTMGGLVGLTMGALLGVKLSQVTFNGDGKLDKEETAKLIVTAVSGLIGGVLGFTIGGPKGAAIGFTIGAGVSVLISKAFFNNDGKLDKEETAKLIVTAVSGLIGGVLGFTIGGTKGAAIGFTIGAGVSVLISKAIFDNDGKLDKEETAKLIVTAVVSLLGGVLGLVIGGPKGAAIGFTIGAGVSVLISNAIFNNDGRLDKEETAKLIVTAVGGLLGGILGFVIGGPKGAAIGFTIGAGVSVMIGEVLFDGDEKVTASKIVDSLVKALAFIVGGAAIGFAIGGPLGAAIGMTIGVALTFAVLSTKWEDKDPSKIGPAGNNPFGDIGTAQKEFQEAVESGEYDPEKAIQDKLGDMLVTGKAKVDVEANFVESRDSLTDAQKTLPGKWNVTGLAPGLGADLSVPAQADFTSSRDSMTPEQKTVGVTAEGREFKNGLRLSPTVSAIARGESYASGFAAPPQQGVRAKAILFDRLDSTPVQDVTARGTTWVNGIGNPVIDTVSKFASVIMGLTKDQRTITTWSQYDAVKSNLTQDERTIKTWYLMSLWAAVFRLMEDDKLRVRIYTTENGGGENVGLLQVFSGNITDNGWNNDESARSSFMTPNSIGIGQDINGVFHGWLDCYVVRSTSVNCSSMNCSSVNCSDVSCEKLFSTKGANIAGDENNPISIGRYGSDLTRCAWMEITDGNGIKRTVLCRNDV